MARAATVVAAVGLAALTVVAPANAQPVTTGEVSFSGDPGDYITGGDSYYYSAGPDVLSVSANGNVVSLDIEGGNGDWWTIVLAAPEGQQLVAGHYTDAQRWPFQPSTKPGLSLSGNGRGCNTLTGSFTVLSVDFGPHGYLEALDATFEQHCEGWEDAARGKLHIVNPPAPAELSLGLGVSTEGTASTLHGRATVRGTVDCTVPAQVSIGGRVTQVKNGVLIRGDYATQVDCVPGAATPWSAQADPTGTTPFARGRAEVQTKGTAQDPNYGVRVEVNKTTAVTLVRVND